MKKLILALALLLPAAALAQSRAPSPEVQALYGKLGAEVDAGIKAATALLEARQQIQALQTELTKQTAEVKRLTDKYEPKKEPAKKP